MRKDSPNTGSHPGETGFSGLLDLRRFERRSRRLLGAGYLFASAVLAILALAWHAPPRVVRTVEKPDYIMHFDIIERPAEPADEPVRITPPKLTRRMERPGFPAPSASPALPGSPSLPDGKETASSFEREIGREVDRLSREYTDTLTVDGGIPRGPGDRMPLRRDTGPDPGMFKADIIYNPANKTATQGYVHIPLVRIEDLKQTDMHILSLRGLAAGINRHTNIAAVFDNPLSPIKFQNSSRHFMQIREAVNVRGVSVDSLFSLRPPLVYILTDRAFLLNEAERGSLGMYLRRGGVLLLESACPGNEKLCKELRSLLWNIFKSYPVEPIPRNHFLYHCFFDFPDGPPEGAGQDLGAIPSRVQPHLDGISIGGRIVALYSDRGYGLCWKAEGRYEEQMKMGVNLVLFSIIQQREQPGRRAVSVR